MGRGPEPKGRKKGLGRFLGQADEGVHLPGDPFILVIEDLTPDMHMKILYRQDGQMSCRYFVFNGKLRKKGDPGIVFQQADDKFRVSNF